jgi:hypothetical protein
VIDITEINDRHQVKWVLLRVAQPYSVKVDAPLEPAPAPVLLNFDRNNAPLSKAKTKENQDNDVNLNVSSLTIK